MATTTVEIETWIQVLPEDIHYGPYKNKDEAVKHLRKRSWKPTRTYNEWQYVDEETAHTYTARVISLVFSRRNQLPGLGSLYK